MKNSISDRIKITKKGKIKRRATALGHSRSNKSKIQILRKKKHRGLQMPKKKIIRLAHNVKLKNYDQS
jgi:ribosomal protein L35